MGIESAITRFILEDLLFGTKRTDIDPDESLISNGVIDSLALLRLIVFVEEQFGIGIDEGEVIPENFETINVIKAFIESKR